MNYFYSFLLFLYFHYVNATVFSSSLKSCQDQCSEKNLAFPLARGEISWNPETISSCGHSCSVKSCHHGCHNLDEPTVRCHVRCTEEGITFESCAQGCQAVEQAFLVQVQELMNSVIGTAEQAEGGVKVIFTFPEVALPQLQEIAAAEFRLAILYRNRVVLSRAVVYTQPILPSMYFLEPTHQRQLANDKVAVCWKTNRENAKIKLSVTTLDGTELQTIESTRRCALLKKLPSENCCRVIFTDISNAEEENPLMNSTTLELKKVETHEDVLMAMDVAPSSPKLIMINGSHILQMKNIDDYVVNDDPIVAPITIPEGDTLTAACGISPSEVVVGSAKGGLWKVAMEFNDTQIETDVTQLRECDEDENRLWQIVYDSINNFIYSVLGDKGILRCPVEKGNCTLVPNTDSLNPVRQIAVDSVNGYLYIVGADHQVYKSTLIPFEAEETATLSDVKPLPELAGTSSIYFDWTEFELYVALKNSSVVVYDAISGEVREKRHTEYMEVTRLLAIGDRLFWTREKCGDSPIDAVCFYSEDTKNSEIEKQPYFSRYLYAATIHDFTFLTIPAQTFSVSPFGTVSFIALDREALITWEDSKPEPFTVAGHQWWNTTTELKITYANETVELLAYGLNRTIEVSPGIEYAVRLRRCMEDICSGSVETKETAMPQQISLSVVILNKSADNIDVFDLLGRPLDMLSTIGSTMTIDISKPFAIDNTTLQYYSVPSEIWINQGTLDNSRSAVLTGFIAISHLAASPSRALLFVASPYQITSFRFTGTFDHTFYSCASATEDCGEVVALSVNDNTGEVHFALRTPKGSLVLFEANQEDRTPRLLAESTLMPDIKQMVLVDEKFVFLTTDGRVGVCDKHLENINVNLEMGSATALLPLTLDMATNLGTFTGEVQMGAEEKDRLMWSLEPRKIVGKTLFKISLYREKLGMGDKRTEITTENGLTLPTDLLEEWSSAQKFDVNIEGLTAWTTISVNKTGLQAPVKPPGKPTATSIYATQQKTVDGARAIITFFWGPPEEWNGTPFQYIVNCTKEDGSTQGGSLSSGITHYSFAVKSGKVSCIVAASNEPSNIGMYTEAVTIDSSELKPLVRLFAIDSNNALMAITDIGNDLTIRRQKRQSAHPMEYQAIAFIGNDLFAVRKEPDSVQPLLVQIDTNDIDNIVHKVSIGGDVGRIEAMTSDWVANRLLFVSGMALYQLSLDPFPTTSLLNPKKLIELSTVATDAKQLTFDPFKNIAYLLTKNGSLFSLNLWQETEQNLALAVPCLSSQTVTWMMTEFAWNRASPPKIFALTWNGLTVVDLEENNKCNEVRIDWNKFGETGLKAVSAFAIADKLFVFVTSSEMIIYGRNRETYIPIPITNPPLRQILAVSQSSQPFPDRSCFTLPSSSGIQFSVINEGKTGAYLDVQKPILPTTCAGVSFPQTHYEVYFTRKNAEKVKHIRSFTERIHVENGILDKETDYEVTVAWLNRYSDVSGISDPKPFRTGFGYPSAPRELRVISVSPDAVYLYWTLPETLNAPINEVKYKVTQQGTGLSSPSTIAVQEFTDNGFAPLSTDIASCLSNPCRAKVSNLRASTEYKFWVTALHTSHLNSQFLEDAEATSPDSTAKTKDVAGTLRPDNVTGSSILLRWNSLQAELPPASISVQYRETSAAGTETQWNSPTNASFDPNVPTLLVLINSLLSATSYDYRFVAAYTGSYSVGGKEYSYKEDYYQGVQQIKTKAGVPTAPQNVEARTDEEGWIVSWQEPQSDGGSPITSYAVEMRINRTSEWEIAERGLDGWKLWWRPAKSNKDDRRWEFRVRAANAEGFGPYANTTETGMINGADEDSPLWSTFVILLGCLFALILLCILFSLIRSYRRKQLLRQKKLLENKNCITLEKMTSHGAPDEPLSAHILRELKHLPIIAKEDLDELKLLSEPTDSKPYEVSHCRCTSAATDEVDVVVKKLTAKANSSKNKLIKEAVLLNNFDHPHVIKLLGVCTTDPQTLPYMVVEYMNEGNLRDLLIASTSAEEELQLSIKDLLGFMVDIGRAGDYLESQRHVYRGLSAKTCYVNNDHGHRIVKLGDFGLVRGTFSDKYILMENPEFQPIRWCSPEVASNLQFSTKSDVWAYGVVMFEIMTQGGVPYSQCTTVQSRLRTGETPSRPRGCPEQIWRLMRSCWTREPDERPRFADLVVELETLKEIPEFQDNKVFHPSGAHYNEAFDVSIDSSSSEKHDMKDQPLFDVSHRSFEQNKFDRSGNSLGGRKNSRPSVVKNQKREKPKPPPLPLPDDIDDRPPFSNSLRNLNEAHYNVYEPPFSASAVGPPRSPYSSYGGLDVPTIARRGYSTESEATRTDDGGHLSKSWAAYEMPLEHGKYIQPPTTPTRLNSAAAPQGQPRKGPRSALHPSSSAPNYQQKVSRV